MGLEFMYLSKDTVKISIFFQSFVFPCLATHIFKTDLVNELKFYILI